MIGVSEEAKIKGDIETQHNWDVVINSELPDIEDAENFVFFEDCQLVTLLSLVEGTLKVSANFIYFYERSKDENRTTSSAHNIQCKIEDIREIYRRRYNLRDSAIEIFLTDQTNYLFNFDKYHRDIVYRKIIALKPANLIHGIARSPQETLRTTEITRNWIQREISNFEYLMYINTLSGRSYNDLSQYPVFPWVLKDYQSDSLDLTNPLSTSCYRDLSKPIGAQIPELAEQAEAKYHCLPQDGLDPPFHWGTHYSNPGAVLYYLVRMEPYTTLHIELHGRFDHPDRQFYSIQQSYTSSTKGQGDCKELIPEFYYLPEFLVNLNKFDFGLKYDGSSVSDVILPPWAQTPEDFIVKHREALESDYVSNHLNEWIDLIFGYKQQGEEAIKAINVYHYTSYAGRVDLDKEKNPKKRRALEAQISNFGQTPSQVFTQPHPKRMVATEASSLRGSKLVHILNAPALKANAIQMGSPADPIVFVGVSAGQPKQVIERGVMDNLVTISQNGVYGIHNWLARWTASHPFYCEKDTQVEEGLRYITGPLSPSLTTHSMCMALSDDGKVLILGGMWDNSVRVVQVNQHELIPLSVLYHHKSIITCLKVDGRYLATGGRDTTVVIWIVSQKNGSSRGLEPHPDNILYGHNSEVTCVDINQEFDIVTSGSKEGIVLIHTLKAGTYVRTIIPYQPSTPESEHMVITFVKVSPINGNIIIAGKIPNSNPKGAYHSVLFLYTINGKLIKRARLEARTTAVLCDGKRIVLGSENGCLEIRCTDYLNVKHKLRLKSGVTSLSLDPRNQHLFVCTVDGKLIIITSTAKPFKK